MHVIPVSCTDYLASCPLHLVLVMFQLVQTFHLHRWCLSPVATCTGGAFFIQPLAQIVHLHTWWYHPLQLALVVLFHPGNVAKTALAAPPAHVEVEAYSV